MSYVKKTKTATHTDKPFFHSLLMHKEELLLLPYKCNKPLPPSESKLLSYQNKGFFEYLDSGKTPFGQLCV